jgi:putative membrane protein
LWGAVISGVAMLVRCIGRSGRPRAEPSSPKSPERLLAERFARGKIGEEEYRQRLAVLHDADQSDDSPARPPVGTNTR